MDRLMVPDFPVMLELVVRATVLISAALALAWVARKGPAGVRHLLWTMTFALLLGLPFLSLFGPSWQLPLLPSPGDPPRQALPRSAPVDVVPDGLITPGGTRTRTRPVATWCPVHCGRHDGRAVAANATASPSVPALGARLRRGAGLVGDGRASFRETCSRGTSALRPRRAAAGERGPPAAGNARRRAALPQPGCNHADDGWPAKARDPASGIGSRVVSRAVGRRAHA